MRNGRVSSGWATGEREVIEIDSLFPAITQEVITRLIRQIGQQIRLATRYKMGTDKRTERVAFNRYNK